MNKRYRLRGREGFGRLRERGRVFRHAWLNVSVVRNDLPHNRYGYITGKALGNAVQRNRVRRLLREGVTQLHEDLEPGFDVLLIARSAILGRPFAEIVHVLETLARQAGMLKAEA